MWISIQPVNIFKGDRYKLLGDNHLTFTALEEPSVVTLSKGDVVRVRSRVSGRNSIRTISIPYDSFVSVWHDAR